MDKQFTTNSRLIAPFCLLAFFMTACLNGQSKITATGTPPVAEITPVLTAFTPTPIATLETSPISPTRTPTPTATAQPHTPTPDLSAYTFPASIDPAKRYLFYLHGKIIEDQGLPAVSPVYGEYAYIPILVRLSSYGFTVISEVRAKNTDSGEYARKVASQVTGLLDAGVPAGNITVVGASKGGGIAILVSYILMNPSVNFVIMSICEPGTVVELIQNQVVLYGNVLSIYDSADELAGSCRELFAFSEDKGMARSDEIVLSVGTGHGILYQPLDEWVLPTVGWAAEP